MVALSERRTPYGSSWVRVRLSILPNSSTGWILRERLGELHTVRTRVVIDRVRLTLTLLRDGRQVLRAPVGIGTSQWPTPAGEFYVRQRLAGFDDPFYGPVAFGLSARSAVLTDWPGGGYVGIHGTNAPGLLPGRVSHGCIRMRNARCPAARAAHAARNAGDDPLGSRTSERVPLKRLRLLSRDLTVEGLF